MNSRDELIQNLSQGTRVLNNPLLRQAFVEVDRADFVGEDYKCEAYEDYALPVGHGATISQPTTVAFMLELLGAKPGDSVLDIGSGSGWTSVLLSKMVGPKGKVTAFEIVPELFKFGEANASKYASTNIKFELAKGGKIGNPGKKFDRILVSASAAELPEGLIEQLNEGGVLVIPVKDSIWKIHKKENGLIDSKECPGFAFVPLK